jgi:hypothetical protein
MEPYAAKQWCAMLMGNSKTLRFGIIAVGQLGDPALIGNLIPLMENDQLSELVSDALRLISGIDPQLDCLEHEGLQAGQQNYSYPDNLDKDLHSRLPSPTERWWLDRQSAFEPGIRYLGGHELKPESTMELLMNGTQANRAAAALELGLVERSLPIFEIRQRADRPS